MKKNVKRKESILSIREKKLAYSLILPTMILVLSIVIIPLLANFWISFKPISLGDLRPPKLILKESVKSKLSPTNDFAKIQYRYRNSSLKYELNQVAFSDLIPKGINVTKIKSQHDCKIEKNKLICKLGKIKPKAFGKIILTIKKNEFWNLINIHFLGCVSHSIILVGIIPMGINAGLSSLSAAGILTTLSVISIFSRIITPIIADKYGSKPIMFFSLFGQGIGVLILLNATEAWEFYTFAVLWAIPYGGEGAAFPIINRQYFGKFPIGTTYGWQIFGAGLGMALGGILPGIIFDLNKSYNLAIILSALFSIFASIIILFLKNTKKEIIPT